MKTSFSKHNFRLSFIDYHYGACLLCFAVWSNIIEYDGDDGENI